MNKVFKLEGREEGEGEVNPSSLRVFFQFLAVN